MKKIIAAILSHVIALLAGLLAHDRFVQLPQCNGSTLNSEVTVVCVDADNTEAGVDYTWMTLSSPEHP